MRIMVTGGAGFIGSHLTDVLVNDGHQVAVVDNLRTGSLEKVNKGAEFQQIDIRSPEMIHMLEEWKPEIVYHLAAQASVSQSLKDPVEDLQINTEGTLRLLEACRKSSVKKLVYTSSAAVYGAPVALPIREDHPLLPLSFYGLSKLSSESYIRLCCGMYGIDHTILRFANVYGTGQASHGESGVITVFIGNLIRKEPLIINGDGIQTRDFVYVKDVVKACTASLAGGNGQTLNIGSGMSISLNELVQLFMKITGTQIHTVHRPPRPGDIGHSVLDSSSAQQILDWSPEHPLEAGLKEILEFAIGEERN